MHLSLNHHAGVIPDFASMIVFVSFDFCRGILVTNHSAELAKISSFSAGLYMPLARTTGTDG